MVCNMVKALSVPLVLLILYNQAIAQTTCFDDNDYCPANYVCCGIYKCCPNHSPGILENYKKVRPVIPLGVATSGNRYSSFHLNRTPLGPDTGRKYVRLRRSTKEASNIALFMRIGFVGLGATLLSCCIKYVCCKCSERTPESRAVPAAV